MKKTIKITPILPLLILIILSFVACDEDFVTFESDLDIGDNFSTILEKYATRAYTKKFEPVQTNGLPVDLLGYYDDNFGFTTSNFVSQLVPATFNPTFPNNVVFDSVVLNIPYFSTLTETDSDGNSTYELDSIFGSSPMKLSIFQSNYFLRDFSVDDDFEDNLQYFSNGTTSDGNSVNQTDLEGTLLFEEDEFFPDDRQIIFTNEEDVVTSRLTPSLRIKFNDLDFWETLILDKEGQIELSNLNNFTNYFRGLYIKTETINSDGFLALMNIQGGGTIEMYYSRDNGDDDNDGIPNFADADIDGDGELDNGEDTDNDGINDESDPDQTGGIDEDNDGIDDSIFEESNSFILNFSGNKINFFDNQFTTPIVDGDEVLGDENLFLKGGEGSMAIIELFDGLNFDSDTANDNIFEEFKKDFVEVNDDTSGEFSNSKRLINEAFLNIYIDESIEQSKRPRRLYIYDLKNNIPLIDYFLDQSTVNTLDEAKTIHLEPIKTVTNGTRYKIRVTEHLNNILLRDSLNVKLGLVVSKNVSLQGDTSVEFTSNTINEELNFVPASSIISPRGVILHGSNQNVPEEMRIQLEIFYTEPNSEN